MRSGFRLDHGDQGFGSIAVDVFPGAVGHSGVPDARMPRYDRFVGRSWLRHILFASLLVVAATNACAATWLVGPAHALKKPSEAARVARSGDTVLIESGLYEGDVAVWSQPRLTISATGGPVVLRAAGASAEGKAIWVVRGVDVRIEGIVFEGARVAERNGAGIRHESGHLLVSRCVFRDNQMGLLTSNDGAVRLSIEDSLFEDSARSRDAFFHLLYAGRIASLTVIGSRFRGGYNGHLLKSRAASTVLRYNMLADGPGGAASYEAEFPNGGDVEMVGNILSQSETGENPAIVSYGMEGIAWSTNRILLSRNTLHSAAPTVRFVHTADAGRGDGSFVLRMENNLFASPGPRPPDPADDRAGGNLWVPASDLRDPVAFDFRLRADAEAKASRSFLPGEAPLPTREFVWPAGTRALPGGGRRLPGAPANSSAPGG